MKKLFLFAGVAAMALGFWGCNDGVISPAAGLIVDPDVTEFAFEAIEPASKTFAVTTGASWSVEFTNVAANSYFEVSPDANGFTVTAENDNKTTLPIGPYTLRVTAGGNTVNIAISQKGVHEGTGNAEDPYTVIQAKTVGNNDGIWIEGYIVGSTDDIVTISQAPTTTATEYTFKVEIARNTIRQQMNWPDDFDYDDLNGIRVSFQRSSALPQFGGDMTVKTGADSQLKFSLNYFTDVTTSVSYWAINTLRQNNLVLKNAITGYDLPIGAAVKHEYFAWDYNGVTYGGWDSDPSYIKILQRDFNSVTAEYTMKMDWMWTGENTFKFDDADKLIAFAQANGMRVHGHTLIWPEVLPTWLKTIAAESKTQGEWEALMVRYINEVVTHFAGKVASWDVVNEAFGPDGKLWGDPTGHTDHNDFWYKRVGSDFIEKAFRAAKAALIAAQDTECKLFYNDYDIVSNNAKMEGIHGYFAGLLQKEGLEAVPIDGIGMQCHVNVIPDYQTAQTAFATMASLERTDGKKLSVHLSELDATINLNNTYTSWWQDGTAGFWQPDYDQGKTFNMIARAYLDNVPQGQQFGITTWGITDRYSMTGGNYNGYPDWPVLFNKWNEPKSAYHGLLEALLNVNWVEMEGTYGPDWRKSQGFEPAP